MPATGANSDNIDSNSDDIESDSNDIDNNGDDIDSKSDNIIVLSYLELARYRSGLLCEVMIVILSGS